MLVENYQHKTQPKQNLVAVKLLIDRVLFPLPNAISDAFHASGLTESTVSAPGISSGQCKHIWSDLCDVYVCSTTEE